MSGKQLSLNHIDLKEDARLSDFRAPSMLPVLAAVRELISGTMQEVFIYGEAGAGKSHLLLAIYSEFLQKNGMAIYLSLRELLDDDVSALVGIEAFRLIILDDIHLVAGHPEWQDALFHLINRARNHHSKLLYSSALPPNELLVELIDLRTRLSQAVALGLPSGELTEDRQAILTALLKQKGWQIPESIFNHIIHHGPHHAGDMLKVLEAIIPLFHYHRGRLPQKLIDEIKEAINKQSLMVELSDINLDTNDSQPSFDGALTLF